MDKEFVKKILSQSQEFAKELDDGLDELFKEAVKAWEERDLTNYDSIVRAENAAKEFADMIFALKGEVQTIELALKEILY